MKNISVHKELTCLHHFSCLVEEEGRDLPGIFRGLTGLLSQAMTFPEECYVRLRVHGTLYESRKAPPLLQEKIAHEIRSENRRVGEIIVGYLLTDGTGEKGFDDNERMLVSYLCERLGRIIERFGKDGEVLHLKRELEIKNASLQEIIVQLKEAGIKEREEQKEIIDKVLYPRIFALERRLGSDIDLEIIKATLKNIRGPGNEYIPYLSQLSPKEWEICQLIKEEYSTKEIGRELTISPKTVERHRANIRKKLNLGGRGKNLKGILKSLDA